jgi:hypothetical protein
MTCFSFVSKKIVVFKWDGIRWVPMGVDDDVTIIMHYQLYNNIQKKPKGDPCLPSMGDVDHVFIIGKTLKDRV